jgi:hypothetical protein
LRIVRMTRPTCCSSVIGSDVGFKMLQVSKSDFVMAISQRQYEHASHCHTRRHRSGELQIGNSYTDVGVIAQDSPGHDLSYKTFLNRALVSNIVIDTSEVATDTIDYVATDTWSNSATSTRTIKIEAPVSTASSTTP